MKYIEKNDGCSINLNLLSIRLLFLAVLFTPLYSIGEVYSFIVGGLINNSTAVTPVYIKIIKDILIFLTIFSSSILILKRCSVHKASFFIFSYTLLTIFIAMLSMTNLLVFMAGVRWLSPIILLTMLINIVERYHIMFFSKLLCYVFLIHLLLQFIQLFNAQGWFGLNGFGFSMRNPGIFFIPSTAAFFSLVVLFFVMFFLQASRIKAILMYLVPLSIFLTASGTGVIVYFSMMAIYIIKRKYIILLPFFVLVLATLSVPILESITGRSGIVKESFGIRVNIFFNALYNSSFFSKDFGSGTSTANLIANNYNLDLYLPSTESLLSGILINTGLLNFCFTLFILLLFCFFAFAFKDKEKLVFFSLYGLFSLTTGVLESFPANIIFSLVGALYVKEIFERCKWTKKA